MEKKKNYFALIMAGGQGTRFWPWSTEERPKQFLNIIGKEPLITQTFNRLKSFIQRENIFVVADGKYLGAVKEAIPEFAEANFIAEPVPRNTAPCLILSNIVLSRLNRDANVMVVPADHYIPDTEVYAAQFMDALGLADHRFIVTAGIKPTMAHTGYGYINFDEADTMAGGKTDFFKVIQFKEKPKRKKAKEYLTAGNYYWNSGMFVYKLRHFKEFLAEYAPYYWQQYQELEKVFADKASFNAAFRQIEAKSIDYALMEKAKEVSMFKARFTWSDVGAWTSVYELDPKDEQNNVASRRNNIFIDSRNSLVFSREDKPIAVIGLKGIAVINTENGILVARMKDLQRVKDVTQELKKRQ